MRCERLCWSSLHQGKIRVEAGSLTAPCLTGGSPSVPVSFRAEQGPGADWEQRPLLRRSRCSQQLRPSVRLTQPRPVASAGVHEPRKDNST